MITYIRYKTTGLFLLLLLKALVTKGQIQISDTSKVDSITFLSVRAAINKIPNTKYEKRVFKDKLPYRLLKPGNYDKSKKYPLILTFHNSSRIGNDNENQLEPLSKIWLKQEFYDKYNCFVVAPQFNERSSVYIKNRNGILVSRPNEKLHLILELLDSLENEFAAIDKSKLYLVGYSMGGSTAQNVLSMAPQRFSSLVSIAAVPDFSNLKAIKNKNIFLIHGAKDADNSYEGSVELFRKLKGSKNIVFKTYTALNHNNINIPLLSGDEIPEWLFNQKE